VTAPAELAGDEVADGRDRADRELSILPDDNFDLRHLLCTDEVGSLTGIPVERRKDNPVLRAGERCLLQAPLHHRIHLGLDLGIFTLDLFIREDTVDKAVTNVVPVLFSLEHLPEHC